jgi:hypothetical protein
MVDVVGFAFQTEAGYGWMIDCHNLMFHGINGKSKEMK